ncbi:McrB family protein [Flavobacterium sinopsychrotolerans]|uniref:5-methylcytosine-specific restriction endonuclease McrBC, GTP-binding regulatory subunit McrB n=1 Tax=Flavobacterium sinopsychrotolerans TaxID=604089 RepID=A0A1H8Q773_9FLAO|nr:hypothetical protein [Flavobacterium sinopsychrotolerans]SEO49613.1 5-methylcytosine-specific restriction endonuclease McrBC, GTP-binding regulatory subunit McrB [Flavobacterium sinopsychrotolerans]
MNFFSIKTSFQDTIKQVLSNNKNIVFNDLSGYDKNKILKGDLVFIIISGDKVKKSIKYENGLRAIGKISKTPLKGKDDKHFGLEVEIIHFLLKSISKKDFYYYPSLQDVGNLGPDTKGSAAQPCRFIEGVSGQNVIRAIKDITKSNLDPSIFDSIVGNNYFIEKLQISTLDGNIKIKGDNKISFYIQEKFVEWFKKAENYKKSYEGLVNLKVLSFWNESYFNNSLFLIELDNLEESFLKTEKLIADKSNQEWKSYSEASSKGAPEAVLGKNNYLKFLFEFLKEENNINKLRDFDLSQNVICSLIQEPFDYKKFHKNTQEAGLIFSEPITARFVASLCTKPFVICSGLSGSGKTKLAQAFVRWICETEEQYKIIPVGADWTNREPLLGYPNAIETEKYVVPENGALELIIKASLDDKKPYFLILDEMNLSHVERYFADFLSAMESGEAIPLHTIEDHEYMPNNIILPKNLFIIGTVNIDETTYMFSPKVLDRANTIEFRVNEKDLTNYFDSKIKLDMDSLKFKGTSMAESFINIATDETNKDFDKAKVELLYFFTELKKSGAEFGYRSASEIGRLIQKLEELGEEGDDLLDIAIMQKLLPKLHGSRSKLSKILITLGNLCLNDSIDSKTKYFDQLDDIDFTESNIKYKLSFEKIIRMYKNALDNGFTSYAEA